MAGVGIARPEGVKYQEKWRIALDLVNQVRSWKLVDQPVVADAAYGRVTEFRDELVTRRLRYVLSVDEDMGYHRPITPLTVAQGLLTDAWQDITWSPGTKRPLRSRFAAVCVDASHGYIHGAVPCDEEWLITEWPIGEEKPTDYWISNTLRVEAGLDGTGM